MGPFLCISGAGISMAPCFVEKHETYTCVAMLKNMLRCEAALICSANIGVPWKRQEAVCPCVLLTFRYLQYFENSFSIFVFLQINDSRDSIHTYTHFWSAVDAKVGLFLPTSSVSLRFVNIAFLSKVSKLTTLSLPLRISKNALTNNCNKKKVDQ